MSWIAPSISTSGSTIGTICASWQISRRSGPRAWALAFDAGRRSECPGDVDHRPPFWRSARRALAVLFQARPEAIRPRDPFDGETGILLAPLSTFDARANRAGLGDQVHQGRAIGGVL